MVEMAGEVALGEAESKIGALQKLANLRANLKQDEEVEVDPLTLAENNLDFINNTVGPLVADVVMRGKTHTNTGDGVNLSPLRSRLTNNNRLVFTDGQLVHWRWSAEISPTAGGDLTTPVTKEHLKTLSSSGSKANEGLVGHLAKLSKAEVINRFQKYITRKVK